jgi:uncharacterized membrane protein
MFDTFLGLPLHVLLLHFTVVLIPLAAVATTAVFWWAPWRRFAGAPLVAVNAALLVLTFVTVQSGQNLQNRFVRIGDMSVPRDDHETFGRALLWIVLALAVVTVVAWLAGRRSALSGALRTSLGVVVAALATASIVLAVLAGHTGSSSHWGDFVENTDASRS